MSTKINLYDTLQDIKERLGDDNLISDEVIKSMIIDYSKIVCTETCYKELPSAFLPYVKSAVIESCQRLGNEGMSSRSELSVTTSYTYADVEASIRSKVKGKRNPRAFLGIWS